MPQLVMVIHVAEGDPEAVHTDAVAAIQAACAGSVAWISSFRLSDAPHDFLDVLEIDDAGATGNIRAAVANLPGVTLDLWPAKPSESLRAPG